MHSELGYVVSRNRKRMILRLTHEIIKIKNLLVSYLTPQIFTILMNESILLGHKNLSLEYELFNVFVTMTK